MIISDAARAILGATAPEERILKTAAPPDLWSRSQETGRSKACLLYTSCTSTDFATEKFLQSAVYGNSDLLLSTLRTVGREVVPVGLTLVPFAESRISSITTKQATQYTVVLTIVPAVIMFGLGLYVIVRRKYS